MESKENESKEWKGKKRKKIKREEKKKKKEENEGDCETKKRNISKRANGEEWKGKKGVRPGHPRKVKGHLDVYESKALSTAKYYF